MLVEKGEEIAGLEGGVAHFERLRIVGEIAEQRLQPLDALGRIAEAPRELQKDRAEATRGGQWVEVGLARTEITGCQGLRLVREGAEDLGGEDEVAIAGDAPHPALGMRWRRDAVEGRVDLDRVEELRQIGELVEFRFVGRIDDVLPVGVAPSGGADADRVHVGSKG